MLHISSLWLTLVIVFSGNILAGGAEELKKAEALFERRGEGVAAIHGAKDIYLKLIKDKRQSNQIRKIALDRYGRLAIFEGEIAKDDLKVSTVTKIFNDCLDATDYLSPKKIGEISPEHTYWRAMCIGLWANNASNTEIGFHIGRAKEIEKLVKLGRKEFRTFDGYGFNRILAGIYLRSNTRAFAALKLYQPEKALALIDEALVNGTNNYMDYVLKGEALIALGKYQEAREALQKGIDELKDKLDKGSIVKLVEVENHSFYRKMFELLATIT